MVKLEKTSDAICRQCILKSTRCTNVGRKINENEFEVVYSIDYDYIKSQIFTCIKIGCPYTLEHIVL